MGARLVVYVFFHAASYAGYRLRVVVSHRHRQVHTFEECGFVNVCAGIGNRCEVAIWVHVFKMIASGPSQALAGTQFDFGIKIIEEHGREHTYVGISVLVYAVGKGVVKPIVHNALISHAGTRKHDSSGVERKAGGGGAGVERCILDVAEELKLKYGFVVIFVSYIEVMAVFDERE